MEELLAIDITDDWVCGLVLAREQKVSLVRSYGLVSLGEKRLGEALAEIIRQTGFERGGCRVAISPGSCSFRNLVLPFQDRRQVAKVLPFELEEVSPSGMTDQHFSYQIVEVREYGTEVMAAMIGIEPLAAVLAELASAGLNPEMVTIGSMAETAALASINPSMQNFVLLDVGLHRSTLVLVEQGRIVLVRSLGVDAAGIGGFSLVAEEAKIICRRPEQIAEVAQRLLQPLQQTVIAVGRSQLLDAGGILFVSGVVGMYPALFEHLRRNLAVDVNPCNVAKRPHLKVEPMAGREWNPSLFNPALALAVWSEKALPLFNFRSGAFRQRRSLKELRKQLLAVALPAVAACLALVGYLGWEYSHLSRQRDVLNAQVLAEFRKTMPEVGRVVNPVQQLKAKVDESRNVYQGGNGTGAVGKLALLAELSARIPEELPVRISRLVADQNDVRIMAETKDFNTVDNVKRELEKSSMFKSVVISSANLAPRGGEVRFELRLQYR